LDQGQAHPLHHRWPQPGQHPVDQRRRIHILDGDGNGIGHAPGTGIPGKSEFPPDCDDDQNAANVEYVARHPQTILALQDNNFWLVEVERDGVTTPRGCRTLRPRVDRCTGQA
jgi:hypothetical protein